MNGSSISEEKFISYLSEEIGVKPLDEDEYENKIIGITNKQSVDAVFKIKDKYLVVEYDGSYWHKNRFLYDKQKSLLILKSNNYLIRVREQTVGINLEYLDIDDNNLFQIKYKWDRNYKFLQICKEIGECITII